MKKNPVNVEIGKEKPEAGGGGRETDKPTENATDYKTSTSAVGRWH